MRSDEADGSTTTALGVDVGSSNVKVVLVRIGASVDELAVCAAPTPADADSLVRVVFDLIRSVVVSAPETPSAIGIASMAESGVPLGADDRPLRPIVRWDGDDDSVDLERLLDAFGADELYRRTGVPALAKAPLVLWAGLRRREPETWAAMSRWAGVADLVGLALTGVLATDHTLAARTMAFAVPPDRALGGWDEELLATVGLDASRLPVVRPSGQPVGPVTDSVAARTGLPSGVPVYIAGHDHSVGGWAAGARRPGEVADSIGTAEALVRVLDAEPDRSSIRPTGMSVTRSVTGSPVLLAGSASSGAFAKWWFTHRTGVRDPGEVLAALADEPVAPTPYTVLPYLSGRQTPEPDRRAVSRVLDEAGRDVDAARGDAVLLARAMFEGLSLHARWMLETQRGFVGREVGAIRVLGGPGGGNRPWMSVKAQVFTAPTRLATVSQPVATGAALLAAVRAGAVADAPELPSVALERDPGDPYDAAYRRFVTAATA
ncbi:L-fuculokinase [Herbiconiux sp. L3-i23]|uniref:FGGY-family carbohydrate kinase n=1 Tax=Herbiconiux sp. L3-i23 TaxID=2905871 RepID=UPI0020508731|nr:FGGY family carbohydrate kinase [Herbiconiux sp. L3-i23]BDI21468.1 hypothetical protein L3i23_02440 [Herbiconiux sp. L3-i23]